MSRQGSGARRGAPLSMLLVGAVVIVVAVAGQRIAAGAAAKGSSSPLASASGEIAGPGLAASGAAGASGAGASALGLPGAGAGLPDGVEDRGWVAEIASQRWLAGSLSGRVLLLPADEIALTATGSSVVSVRYGSGGRTSTVRVRDLAGGRLRASVDRPGTISSAVVAGTTVYVTGDAGTGGGADAGVQAINLADGSVRDVIPAGPAPSDATGPVTRTQLRLDPAGTILGSPLCSGDRCSVDVVTLASGARTTPVRNGHGFLVALTDRVLYLTDDNASSLDAVDAVTGDVRWHLDGLQLQGVTPSSDGTRALVGFLPAGGGPPTFTLAAADAASGGLRVLLRRAADTVVPTFYPGLSGDRVAVIGGDSLGELLGGGSRRAALSLVDATTGATRDGAITLVAP